MYGHFKLKHHFASFIKQMHKSMQNILCMEKETHWKMFSMSNNHTMSCVHMNLYANTHKSCQLKLSKSRTTALDTYANWGDFL